MKLNLDQIKASSTPLAYHEEATALNERLHEGTGAGDDFRFPEGLDAALEHYRAGLDVVFEGEIRGTAEGTCARCLEAYRFPFDERLRVVLAPRATAEADEGDDDLGLGYFDGDEIDVTGLVVEHVLLTLPTIPLCREECLGLCPQCGTDRNVRACECVEAIPATGGLATLARLKIMNDSGGR